MPAEVAQAAQAAAAAEGQAAVTGQAADLTARDAAADIAAAAADAAKRRLDGQPGLITICQAQAGLAATSR